MTSRFVRFLLGCLLLLAMASPGFAARRSSLAGNLLIQDRDDIFIYPHLVTMHQRHVTFDIGSDDGLGSGGLIWGNEDFTVGAFSHRSDFWGAVPTAFFTEGDIDLIGFRGHAPVGTPVAFDSILPNIGPDQGTLNWIDLLFGFKSGDNPIGLRVSVGHNKVNLQDSTGGRETELKATGFNAVLGARIASMATDLSAEVSYFSNTTGPDSLGFFGTPTAATVDFKPFTVAVSARRTAGEESDNLSLGWLGMFAWQSGSIEPSRGGTKIDTSALAFVAGLGPVYRPSDRTNIAAYGTFEIARGKAEGTGNDDLTLRSIAIPGWHIAAEVDVASWLQFRAGLRSRYSFNKIERNGTTLGGPVFPSAAVSEITATSLDYRWLSGIGLHFDNFHFDGVFDPSLLTNGSSLLGADGHPVFGLVTASYDF